MNNTENIKGKKGDVKFLDPINAIEVKQGDFTFYTFSISAKLLLSIAYTSERTRENRMGIQRGLSKKRLKEIGQYLQGNVSGPPILPNAIIVSLSEDSYFENNEIHIVNRPTAEAFVLDGQHRLWAFDNQWAGDIDLEIIVSAFIDLEDSYKALIFKTINGEQKKINPSLVYDLIPMLRNTNWVQFEDQRAKEIIDSLNTTPGSAWNDRIGMLGTEGRLINQASFITAIKKLFKKGHIFSSDDPDFFEEEIQTNLLLNYFNEIANHFPTQWGNKAYLLCKYVGVSSVLNLLEQIIYDQRKNEVPLTDSKGILVNRENFQPYILRLSSYAFSAKTAKKEGKSYVGEAGVNELTKVISNIVFPS